MSDTKVYVKEVGVDSINFQEVDKETLGTKVVANPVLTGDEPKLTGLQVGNSKYSVGDVGLITIEASQILSENSIQLTEAQGKILEEHDVVKLNFSLLTGIDTAVWVFANESQQGVKFFSPTPHINGDGEVVVTKYIYDYATKIVSMQTQNTLAVIANIPSATQELKTLRVGDRVYSIPSGLPTVTSADDDKVLTVENGRPTWKTPVSGGGGDTADKEITVGYTHNSSSSAYAHVYTNFGEHYIQAGTSQTIRVVGVLGIEFDGAHKFINSDDGTINHSTYFDGIRYFAIKNTTNSISIVTDGSGGGAN